MVGRERSDILKLWPNCDVNAVTLGQNGQCPICFPHHHHHYHRKTQHGLSHLRAPPRQAVSRSLHRGCCDVCARPGMPGSYFRGRPHRAAGGLRDPWPEPSSSRLATALSARAARGSGWRNGFCEVSAPRPGLCSPSPRRLGRDAPQTPARLRLDRSDPPAAGAPGSCFQPGTGLGTRQVSNSPGAGAGGAPAARGGLTATPPPQSAPGPGRRCPGAPAGSRRFPIEAGDSLALPPPRSGDSPEPASYGHSPVR